MASAAEVAQAMWITQVMEQAQVLASAWSLVGSRFDDGGALDHAEAMRRDLRDLVAGGPVGLGGAVKADIERELEISTDELIAMIGPDLAKTVHPHTLAGCLLEASPRSHCVVTGPEVAVARALVFRVSGSALLAGERRGLGDAGTLMRMLNTANNLLAGKVP